MDARAMTGFLVQLQCGLHSMVIHNVSLTLDGPDSSYRSFVPSETSSDALAASEVGISASELGISASTVPYPGHSVDEYGPLFKLFNQDPEQAEEKTGENNQPGQHGNEEEDNHYKEDKEPVIQVLGDANKGPTPVDAVSEDSSLRQTEPELMWISLEANYYGVLLAQTYLEWLLRISSNHGIGCSFLGLGS
jgi:hypothetical protein